MSNYAWLILVLGLVTYLTRSSGHVVLSMFRNIHPRVEAALDAVPAAVIATLVIPPALTGGGAEFIAMAVAVVAAFRLNPLVVIAIGLAVVAVLRSAGF